jgi:pimeloyl-ACP methyl ester carboxylesterase
MSSGQAFGVALKYVIVSLLIIVVAAVISLLLLRVHLKHEVMHDTRITSSEGIDSLEQVTLGGAKQWILIRGHDKSNPVLLHLHGGPGSADIAVARHYDAELVKHFVMVHWDQKGAGKSYNPKIPLETMTRKQFVSDVLELSETLRNRFAAEKIYLVGHSWGSEIGTIAVSQKPELFHAYVGIGQVVNNLEAEKISYQFTLDKAQEEDNQEALKELQDIQPPPYDEHSKIMVQRKWLTRFGGVFHQDMTFNDLIKVALKSPDYSLYDGIRFFRGEPFSTNALWNTAFEADFFTQIPRLDVPVYFFAGRYDYNTPSELVERYYEQLEAPKGKHLIWFEESGHMIPFEEHEKYCDMLINKVLKNTSIK